MLRDVITGCITAATVAIFSVAIFRKGEEDKGRSPIRYKDITILLLVLLFIGAVFGWFICMEPARSIWGKHVIGLEPHINMLMKFTFLTSVLGGILPTGLFIAYLTLRLAGVPKDICRKTGTICKESAFWIFVGILIGILLLEMECAAVGNFSPAGNLIPHCEYGTVYMLAVYLQASLAPASIAAYTGLVVDGVRTIPQFMNDVRNRKLEKQGKHYKKY